MELNKNYEPLYVIGNKFSYSTLKAMTKDDLIYLLNIAQHNYECMNERLYNVSKYVEELDNALTEACKDKQSLYQPMMDTIGYHYTIEDYKNIYIKRGEKAKREERNNE